MQAPGCGEQAVPSSDGGFLRRREWRRRSASSGNASPHTTRMEGKRAQPSPLRTSRMDWPTVAVAVVWWPPFSTKTTVTFSPSSFAASGGAALLGGAGPLLPAFVAAALRQACAGASARGGRPPLQRCAAQPEGGGKHEYT